MTAPARRMWKRHWGQAMFAATLAAWILFIAFCVLNVLFQEQVQQDGRPGQAGNVIAIGIIGFPVALFLCVFAGVPCLALVYWWKLSRLWQVALVGACAGGLVGLGLVFVLDPINRLGFNADTFITAIMFAVIGAGAGAAAWASLWLDSQGSGGRQRADAP